MPVQWIYHLERMEMSRSPVHLVNADSSDPVNTWQEINTMAFSIRQNKPKFSPYKSDKMFGSGGKAFFHSKGHTRSR